MILLHQVQEGDTINSIADQYNVPLQRLINDNGLYPGSTLNVGQIIAITYPELTYMVNDGDTLSGIAQMHGVSVMELLRNNPTLSDREYLEVGEELVISYGNRDKRIRVNGMTFSFINERILRKTLPFLTYITIMGHQVDAAGNLTEIDDTKIIQMAIEYSVVPLMLVYALDEAGQGTTEITHILLNNQVLQNRLIDNIITVLSTKGYYGATFGFQYVLEEDLQKYVDFIKSATERLHDLGYLTGAVLIPNTFGYQEGQAFGQPYFADIGQVVDGVILLSYQWASGYIPDIDQTTYPFIKNYLDTVITQIPTEKIYLGLSRIAYDWELPYVEGESFVSALTNPGALALANQYGSEIYFDDTTQISYFIYNVSGTDHEVRFIDGRYTNALLKLVSDYGLGGISVWSIMYFFRIWLIINSQFDIEKLLPTV